MGSPRQHTVPRFLLKRFAIPGTEHVWVYDKHESRSFKANCRNVAAERGFYDLDLGGGIVATIEPGLSQLEGRAATIVEKIVSSRSLAGLTPEERGELSHFVAVQKVRAGHLRVNMAGIESALADRLREMGSELADVEGYEPLDSEKIKQLAVRQVTIAGEQYAPHFRNKAWVLFETDASAPFWISDNPVALQNETDTGPYGNLGLEVKGIEIYVPISSTLTLAMHCPSIEERWRESYLAFKKAQCLSPVLAARMAPDPLYVEQLMAGFESGRAVPIKRESLVRLNSLQVMFSTRFLYSSGTDFSLARTMIERNPSHKHGLRVEVVGGKRDRATGEL